MIAIAFPHYNRNGERKTPVEYNNIGAFPPLDHYSQYTKNTVTVQYPHSYRQNTRSYAQFPEKTNRLGPKEKDRIPYHISFILWNVNRNIQTGGSFSSAFIHENRKFTERAFY